MPQAHDLGVRLLVVFVGDLVGVELIRRLHLISIKRIVLQLINVLDIEALRRLYPKSVLAILK